LPFKIHMGRRPWHGWRSHLLELMVRAAVVLPWWCGCCWPVLVVRASVGEGHIRADRVHDFMVVGFGRVGG